jgi:hypothetical protein
MPAFDFENLGEVMQIFAKLKLMQFLDLIDLGKK